MDELPALRFAALLRELRTARGVSLAALGDVTAYHRAAVANVEAGRRHVDERFAAAADRALGGEGRLVDAWRHDEQVRAEQTERRRLLDRAVRDSAELAHLADVDRLGDDAAQLAVDYLSTDAGTMLRRTLAARADTVTLLRNGHSPAQHTDLLVTAGRMSGVLAYAALDLGRPDHALMHTEAAWQCAELAGDDELRAWIRGTQSLIVRFGSDYRRALDLARDGMQYAKRGTAAARLLCGQAQCLAQLGDSHGANAALNAAEDAREHATGCDTVGGLLTFSETKQRYYAGSSLIWLGDPPNAQRAAVESQAAIERWATGPAADRSLDDEALAHLYLSTARLQLGELDGAVDALRPILDLPAERRISWITKRLDNVVSILTASPYDHSPAARSAVDEIRAYG